MIVLTLTQKKPQLNSLCHWQNGQVIVICTFVAMSDLIICLWNSNISIPEKLYIIKRNIPFFRPQKWLYLRSCPTTAEPVGDAAKFAPQNAPAAKRYNSLKVTIILGSWMLYLKGQLQGHTAIFKGLKMAFITKKKLYHVTSISVKNTTNFVLTTFLYDDFFYRALDARRTSLLATSPMLRITYQSCSPPSADTLQICAHFW